MPQLNPVPWFMYLCIVWLIILFLAPKKILSHTSLNEPNPKNVKTADIVWTWPWQ
nr:ATP synthase F0 subunit 8 [Nidirana yeae]